MRFPDLLIMSMNNLRRRKLRTVLTVLGVIIGTAAIVVMVSLGIGLNEMTMEQIASWGSLTTIQVSSQNFRRLHADHGRLIRTEKLEIRSRITSQIRWWTALRNFLM